MLDRLTHILHESGLSIDREVMKSLKSLENMSCLAQV